jgi:hypothetical protein
VTVCLRTLRFIACTRAALKNGVLHFALDGRLLTTELEIAEALERDGRVEFDVSARVARTTVEAERARAEFGAGRGRRDR